LAGPILKYSLPLLPTTVVALIAARADRFLIRTFLDLEALGIYSLALKLSSLLEQLIAVPFSTAYGSFRFTIMKDEHASEIQARVVRYLVLAATCAGVAIVLLSGDVVRVIAEPEYWPAVKFLPILVLAAVLKVMVYPFQTGILYAKRTGHLLEVTIAAASCSVAVNVLSLRSFGVAGACLAQFAASTVALGLTDRISRRYLPVHYDYRTLARVIGLGIVACGVGISVSGLHPIVAIAARVVIALGFCYAISRPPILMPEEVRHLRERTLRALWRHGIRRHP
jgi:O-antigen/teichoic acid export membrane protein